MAKHKHGTMKIISQERTFDGFVKALIWGVAICVGVLIFLALFAA
ncbi:MAG: aa3-type cytochrome c oxidase subunit IV [Pseudomonadota bacterium]